MGIRMTEIRDLVKHWREVALDENRKKFDTLREQAIDEYLLDNPRCAELIRACKASLCVVKTCEEKLGAYMPGYLGFTTGRDPRKEVFNEHSGSSLKAFPFLAALHSDRLQTECSIESEYSRLGERITACRTGGKAKKMIDEMGLDTSSIKEFKNPPVALEHTPLNLALMGLAKKEDENNV